MGECTACGTITSDDASTCPTCGSAMPGSTESFEPVGPVVGESSGPVATEGPVLVVRKGPETGERFYVDRSPLTVGRDPESDIFLNDMTVSRQHAHLELVDGVVTVHDDGSLNGTYVNGVCVDRAQLGAGDVVQIGTFQMVFFGGRAGS